MKLLLGLLVTLMSFSTLANDFERGFNAGLKACSEDNYYICTADYPGARLKMRELNRGVAIKKLYDYCLSPSASVYRAECSVVIDTDKVICHKL